MKRLISDLLTDQGYDVTSFDSASDFLRGQDWGSIQSALILSDVVMPGVSGYELCQRIRSFHDRERVPIVLMSGSFDERATGIEAGADDFLEKPFSKRDLFAKVRSLFAIRAREISTLSELEDVKKQNDELNTSLEADEDKLKKLGRLTQFLSPKVAELLISSPDTAMMSPHRAEVSVMFVDLRRFTQFAEKTDPVQVQDVLHRYYEAVGKTALKYNATLGNLAGDGMMVFLNDPEPINRHQEVAVRMANEIRGHLISQRSAWRETGYEIDFGIGLAEGVATIGAIGFDRFWQYSVIGPVSNLAARLCQIADQGQILMSHTFSCRLSPRYFTLEHLGQVCVKGIDVPINVLDLVSIQS